MLTTVTKQFLPAAMRAQLCSPAVYPILSHAAREIAAPLSTTLGRRARLSSAAAAATSKSKQPSIAPAYTDFDIDGRYYYPQQASGLPSEAFKMDLENENLIRRFSPRYAIIEDGDAVKIEIEVPNAKPEDLSAHIEDGSLLHVSGFSKTAAPEVSEARFDQRFTVGPNVNRRKVEGNLVDGVLTISLPKVAPGSEETIQRIPITDVEGEVYIHL